ncbi:hypothetical protein MJ581_19705 [Escherichia coli]|nr:hypothetical protein MJ581_19705 [Escherichia coli]
MQEFPDLDVSLRGAVAYRPSFARSAGGAGEKSIRTVGVGQYQHDVSQTQLARKLDAVVEDCVNAVGVDPYHRFCLLLTRVAGLTRMMAQKHRGLAR